MYDVKDEISIFISLYLNGSLNFDIKF